jgi:hypothetical protein
MKDTTIHVQITEADAIAAIVGLGTPKIVAGGFVACNVGIAVCAELEDVTLGVPETVT